MSRRKWNNLASLYFEICYYLMSTCLSRLWNKMLVDNKTLRSYTQHLNTHSYQFIFLTWPGLVAAYLISGSSGRWNLNNCSLSLSLLFFGIQKKSPFLNSWRNNCLPTTYVFLSGKNLKVYTNMQKRQHFCWVMSWSLNNLYNKTISSWKSFFAFG